MRGSSLCGDAWLVSQARIVENHIVARSLSTLLIHFRPHFRPHDFRPPHEQHEQHEGDPATAQAGRPIAPAIERSSTFTLDGPGAEALATGIDLREHDVAALLDDRERNGASRSPIR